VVKIGSELAGCLHTQKYGRLLICPHGNVCVAINGNDSNDDLSGLTVQMPSRRDQRAEPDVFNQNCLRYFEQASYQECLPASAIMEAKGSAVVQCTERVINKSALPSNMLAAWPEARERPKLARWGMP
jgi:hypothetical protein